MQGNGTFRSYFGAVAVPILDKGDGTISNVTHDWANATAALGGGLAITIMRLQIKNYRVDIAKQRLAEMALANNCQFVLFVDDDVIIPPDALMKMIKLWKSDPKYKIISGVYWSKSDPSMPLIFDGNLVGSKWDWTTQDLIKADGAGAGCLFVDTEVFRKMPKPWFSCNYYFEDPRGDLDLQRWNIGDALINEISRGKDSDPNKVADYQRQLAEVVEKIQLAQTGYVAPELLKNKHQDSSTTEDLYFFKKAKEVLGDPGQLWVDCSIQCAHQDKRTGRVWVLSPDMPQSKPRYADRLERGKRVVLDIGCGDSNYYIPEGVPIRIDNDPSVNPDIIADARQLPIEDCFADQVNASHLLEHFSFHETLSVLREWVRTLKIGGKLVVIVPNAKWAAANILNPPQDQDQAERTVFFFCSAQKGDLKNAKNDMHMAIFTPESLRGLLNRLGSLKDIEVHTSEGNYGNWKDPDKLHTKDDMGYNLIAIATKAKHEAAISLKAPLQSQEEAKYKIGETAIPPVEELGLSGQPDVKTKVVKKEVKNDKPTKRTKSRKTKKG